MKKNPCQAQQLTPLQKAICKTFAYFAVFNDIPSFEQLHKYLIGEKASKEELEKEFNSLNVMEICHPVRPAQGGETWDPQYKKMLDPGFRLIGGSGMTTVDRLMENLLFDKISLAKKRALFVRFIPGVQAVFLTGDLSIGSAKESSDIDFLIVCKNNWLRRVKFLLFLTYSLLGWRESHFFPLSSLKNNKTSVCFNIFLEESALAMPTEKQNLFVAFQVAQVQPLYDRGGVYERFLEANLWASRFLPNAFGKGTNVTKVAKERKEEKKANGSRQLFLHKNDLTDKVLLWYKQKCTKQCL